MNRILTLSIPVLMGYFPLGLVFGFLFVQIGVEWWLAPLMSLLVFAGAIQFLAISLIAVNASFYDLALATFIVNLRHIFYGISLIDVLPEGIFRRAYCIASLTDENYSVLTNLEKEERNQHWLALAVVHHMYWVLGAAGGAFFGIIMTESIEGIEFSLTALFAVLAVEQYRRLQKFSILFITIASGILTMLFIPEYTLIVAIAGATVVILSTLMIKNVVMRKNSQHQKTEPES